MSDPPESTYAVLGLVDKIPGRSGYELTAIARRSLAHSWPISQTLLYRELARLADLGWVTVARVEQTGPPDKFVYRPTPAGQDALAEWLETPVAGVDIYRSGCVSAASLLVDSVIILSILLGMIPGFDR